MYYALNLTKETQNKLWKVFYTFFDQLNNDWVTYMDHITLIHSSHPAWEVTSRILHNFEGHKCEFYLTSVGISEVAIAFGVDIDTANQHSHITIAMKGGHFPVEANEIAQWDRLYCDETFEGYLTLNP